MAKWKEISDLIYAELVANTTLTALLSNDSGSIYPLIATAKEGDVFITYHVQYQGRQSKDARYVFDVIIRSYADSYNKGIAVADEVTNAFEASSENFIERGGKPAFTEENEFYIEQSFNIKK